MNIPRYVQKCGIKYVFMLYLTYKKQSDILVCKKLKYMSLTKKIRDQLIKVLYGKTSVPSGLFELSQYFRHYEPINFREEAGENGNVVAISTNYRYGSIITSGKTLADLEKNIKDAILTSFDIPSSFAKEAGVHKVGAKQGSYALA